MIASDEWRQHSVTVGWLFTETETETHTHTNTHTMTHTYTESTAPAPPLYDVIIYGSALRRQVKVKVK